MNKTIQLEQLVFEKDAEELKLIPVNAEQLIPEISKMRERKQGLPLDNRGRFLVWIKENCDLRNPTSCYENLGLGIEELFKNIRLNPMFKKMYYHAEWGDYLEYRNQSGRIAHINFYLEMSDKKK